MIIKMIVLHNVLKSEKLYRNLLKIDRIWFCMDKPLFYCSPELENSSNLIKELKKYSENEGKTVYIIKQPLMKLQDENAYDYDKAFIVLIQ